MTMQRQLPRLLATGRETKSIGDVVQPAFEILQERRPSHAFCFSRLLEITTELSFQNAIDATGLLLLTQLRGIVTHLASHRSTLPMLSRRIIPFFNRTFGREAAIAFEK